MANVHAELKGFDCKGGLFDVGDTSLLEDVGARVRFVTPRWPAEEGEFVITAIQKDYHGELCYRVVGGHYDEHQFGRVAHVNEVVLV